MLPFFNSRIHRGNRYLFFRTRAGNSRYCNRLHPPTCALLCLLALGACSPIFAQTQHNELSDYTAAVAHPEAGDRLRALEQFASNASPGAMKVQAMEFIISEYLHVNDRAAALRWATQLQSADPSNSLALDLITDNARTSSSVSKNDSQQKKLARQGLQSLPQLMRPLGMKEADFAALRQSAQAMLKGALGAAELQEKDYAAARNDLRDALAADPDNAANMYALALADLDAKDGDAKEGYLYLARAVRAWQGTPQGDQIATYARNRYIQDGGSSGAWDQFLAAASPAEAAAQPAVVATGSTSGTKPAGNSTAAKTNKQTETSPVSTTVAGNKASASPATVASKKVPSASRPSIAKPAPSIWGDDTPYNPTPVRKRRATAAGGPMSLGILVETSLANKENRSAVVNSLTDMLRHLGENDEAFILTYDNNLVFQTDLTTDPHQLEDALAAIKPQKGAVLDDAVAFAAGHLARIAKNNNRVLLVISDGQNIDSETSPIRTSAEINAAGIRIYCIGVGVAQNAGRYRLQALSSSTGGRSSFIPGTAQFRDATVQMAKNMGIDFRY